MRLTSEQTGRFRRDGVLVVPDAMPAADLQPLIDDLDMAVDRRAREFQAEGLIADLHAGRPFANRFTYLHRQCERMGSRLDIVHLLTPAIFAFLRHDGLLDLLEGLLGPEISCSPIQHIRPKVPAGNGAASSGLMGAVPWHQDAGVTWEEADASDIVTVWMPLVDATREIGCMQVLPGVFRQGYLAHVASDYGTMIDPAVLPEVEPMVCECPKGGAVLMNKYTPHMGLPNTTADAVRWTIDLRYQVAGTPTGRPFQPDFVARSRSNPASELRDAAEWAHRWREALAKPQPALHRVAR